MSISNTKLEKLILDLELIDKEKLALAQKKSKEAKMPLDQYLVANEYIKDSELGQIIGDHFEINFVDLTQENIDSELARIIPEKIAQKKQTIVYKQDKENVYVATTNPKNYYFLKSLERKIGKEILVTYATARGISKALRIYKNDALENVTNLVKDIEREPDNQEKIVQLVDSLVEYANDSGASDIHMEPSEKDLAFRLRIDGVMHKITTLPKKLSNLVLTRIKIMSKLRTDEKRSPQDGKFRFKTADGVVDVRVSVVPVTQGENVVMRLLAAKGQRFFLKDLGFLDNDLEKINSLLKSPHGMILITGPTGSGKTTTLYSMLQILHKPEVSVSTIEDPVEYDMEGISQIQVDNKVGLTFARGLRSIVRQDPDIIMVGEVRDQETSSIAVNSAMTGHLVLSTLHANNAPTAIPRLLDMEIEPFLVGSTVNVVIAQRLVRKICEKCRSSYTLEDKEIVKNDSQIEEFFKEKGYGGKKKIRLYKGTGCSNCNGTGYKGRIGIFEVMEMTEGLKPLVLKRVSSDEIMDKSREEGMTTMLEDGLEKVLSGITTLDEVIRVTKL